jgi:hypothetical protein
VSDPNDPSKDGDWEPTEWKPTEWKPRDWTAPPPAEETMPFTHRPYGEPEPESPYTSPDGASTQDSGPAYVAPSGGTPQPSSPPPPPTVPYGGGPVPPPQPYYAGPLPGAAEHKGATTSMVLAIIALVSVVLTPFCCVTLVALPTAPFAWATGRKALKQIDRAPGYYRNRGQAAFGMWTGIICTILFVIALIAIVAFFVWAGTSDFSTV